MHLCYNGTGRPDIYSKILVITWNIGESRTIADSHTARSNINLPLMYEPGFGRSRLYRQKSHAYDARDF
jgi:hypothetical protein